MAKYAVNFTTNAGPALLCYVDRRRDAWVWQGTFYASGTFGGGTVSWTWSPDGGVTQIPISGLTGQAATTTANGSFNAQFGNGSKLADQITIYATLAGATGTFSVTAGVYDNH